MPLKIRLIGRDSRIRIAELDPSDIPPSKPGDFFIWNGKEWLVKEMHTDEEDKNVLVLEVFMFNDMLHLKPNKKEKH